MKPPDVARVPGWAKRELDRTPKLPAYLRPAAACAKDPTVTCGDRAYCREHGCQL